MVIIGLADTVAFMSLARLDLNLLVSLDALLEERSVTRAAARLGLSQPTLSGSLARLRRHFDDDLLVRVGNEYRLTPLGVRLRQRAHLALGDVARIFETRAGFDPSTTAREFNLLISDYALTIAGRNIANLLAAEAPRARLRMNSVTSTSADLPEQALLANDLLFMPHGFVAEMSHRDVFQDDWLCIVAADNDAVGDKLTVKHLRTLPWVASYFGPTASTPAARQMRMLGIEPHVQVVTENFLTVPGLVAGSDRIALLQRRLVERVTPLVGVRAFPCPFPAGPLIEAIWWHPVNDDDPEHAYLRDLIARACATLSA